MKNFFHEKGTLTVSIGEGYLSAYEVSVLKPGDIVTTAKLAAEGFSVFFNGEFLMTAEVVIIDTFFGLRVTSLVPPKVGAQVPGNSDEAIEMLPFMVRLGQIPISLRELKGVGPGTIIHLDSVFSEEEDGELQVAGIPVAKGKVGVTYENMSLRITKIDGEKNALSGLEVRSSGNLIEKDYDTQYTKDYNFKRPDKFSRNAIERMMAIHDLFVRNLRLKYGVFEDYEIIGDQLTFGEFLAERKEQEYQYLLLQNRPWPREIRGEHEAGMLFAAPPSTYYVEREKAQYPATDEHKEFIRTMVTGEGREMLNGVFLCFSQNESIREMVEHEEKRDFLLASLRGAWKNIVSMNFQLGKKTDNVEDIKVMHDNEMILLLTVRAKKNQEDLMHIIYPYLTLHPYVSILN